MDAGGDVELGVDEEAVVSVDGLQPQALDMLGELAVVQQRALGDAGKGLGELESPYRGGRSRGRISVESGS